MKDNFWLEPFGNNPEFYGSRHSYLNENKDIDSLNYHNIYYDVDDDEWYFSKFDIASWFWENEEFLKDFNNEIVYFFGGTPFNGFLPQNAFIFDENDYENA